MKNQNKVVIYIIVVLVLAIVMFLSFRSIDEKADDYERGQIQDEVVVEEPSIIITAKHSFSDGVHIVAGEVEMPTPCDLLESEVVVMESFPEQVLINFKTINQSEGLCAQVITPARFKVEFSASEGASISATLNGERVILNLIEAREGEDLDDFEIFIKG